MTPSLRAYLALGLGIFALGISAILVRWAEAPGTVSSFYRMALASVILAPAFYRRVRKNADRRPDRPLFRAGLGLAVLGGISFAADLGLWSTGVVLSGASIPTLLANTAPVWVGLGAHFLFRERLNRRFWAGLALALFGSLLILGLDALKSMTLGLGALFGLTAGIFYAGYFLITQRGRRQLDSLTYFWPSAVSSTVVLLLVVLALRQPLFGYPLASYLNFAALGVVTQVIGYLAVNEALGYLPASLVSPTLIGQPLLTAIFAWLLLGERLSVAHLAGGAAVITGIIIVHRNSPSLGG